MTVSIRTIRQLTSQISRFKVPERGMEKQAWSGWRIALSSMIVGRSRLSQAGATSVEDCNTVFKNAIRRRDEGCQTTIERVMRSMQSI
jgi:hypothetical protein